MHSTHFIYGYMASDIWLRTILIVRKETSCRHIGYSYWLTAKVLLYAPSHRQDNTYHSLCYNSRGTLAGTRNSSYHGATSRSQQYEQTLIYQVIPDFNEPIVGSRHDVRFISPCIIIQTVHSLLMAFQGEVCCLGTKMPNLSKKQ